MRTWCLLVLAVGCAEIPASDNPLEPVPIEIQDPEPPPHPPKPPPGTTDGETALQEVTKAAKAIAEGQDPVEAKAKAKAKHQGRQATARGVAGPIRLVTSLPDAVPPRAILALPGGKEIVVKPGQMVPEVGLIVLRISADSVEISRVEPDGHQATVHNETLHTPN